MLEIKITVHCPDLLALAGLLANRTAPEMMPCPTPAKSQAVPAAPVAPAVPVATAMPAAPAAPVASAVPVAPLVSTAPAAPTPPAVPLSQAPQFTLAQISRAGAELITKNPAIVPQVGALLAQYGVQTVDKLKPDQLGPFATALRGLGANI